MLLVDILKHWYSINIDLKSYFFFVIIMYFNFFLSVASVMLLLIINIGYSMLPVLYQHQGRTLSTLFHIKHKQGNALTVLKNFHRY